MAFSGIIPTIQVSSNSIINNIAGGLVNNAVDKVVNVALSTTMGQQVTKFFGLPPVSDSGSIVTPGLASSLNQNITNAITGSLINSNALGPAGSLVSSLASNAVGSVLGGVTGGLFPSTSTEQASPTRFFPGAGDEEDANYGGKAYTPGSVGPDVVFSIKPATTTANAEVQSQVSGDGAGVAAQTAADQLIGGGENPLSESMSANLYKGTLSPMLKEGYKAPVFKGNLMPPNFKGSFETAFSASAPDFSKNLGTLNTSNGSLSVSQAPSGGTSSAGSKSDSVSSPWSSYSLSNSSIVSAPTSIDIPTEFSMTEPLVPGTPSFFNTSSLVPNASSDPELKSALEDTNFGFSLPGEPAEAKDEGWNFTTSPQDISWDSAAKVDRVPIFGTNAPPVTSGSRGMRDLSLSNALIEGFSFGKSVEGKIAKLESLLNYTLTSSYVKVPVYWVCAQDKKYGASNNDGGYFVIKQIKVKEELRDLSGNTTRALVDIGFTQVPSYQVDDGRDQASKSISGGTSILDSVSKQVDKNIDELKKSGALESGKPGKGGKSSGGKKGNKKGSSKEHPGKVLYKGVWVDDKKVVNNTVLVFDAKTGKYE